MKRHTLQILLMLALFGAYTICALFLNLIGANVYSMEASNIENNYDMRTGVLYLSEKIRQNDVENSIRVDQVSGSDALVLTENKSGKGYETWIYVYGDSLCEILTPPRSTIKLSAGQVIMPVKSMRAEYKDQMLIITLYTMSNKTTELIIYPRSAREAV